MFKFWFFALSILCLCNCQNKQHIKNNSFETLQNDIEVPSILYKKESSYRTLPVQKINYQLIFDLTNKTKFEIDSQISFHLSNNDNPIFMDFINFKINKMIINGKDVYPNYNGKRLKLNQSNLKIGNNVLKIVYTGMYQQRNDGLNYWIDSKDNRTYLYSKLHSKGAATLFPTFSQQESLSTFNLLVYAPFDWHIISTTKEIKVPSLLTKTNNSPKLPQPILWQFPTTKPMKPANFSIFAGPFNIQKSTNQGITLRFLSPKSKAKDLQYKISNWLSTTNQSLEKLNNYLNIKYPFKKYDQVWLPNLIPRSYNSTTTVMFTNKLLLNKNNELQKNLITSSLGKQWFSYYINESHSSFNWLNESLNEYVSQKISLNKSHTSSILIDAYHRDKKNAYNHDRLIDDNLSSISNSNNVASLLQIKKNTIKSIALFKQLNFKLGDNAFRSLLKNYLKNQQHSNVTPPVFFAMLANKASISNWQNEWLYTPGVNQIEVNFQCENNLVNRLSIVQYPDNSESLRQQKIKLGFFYKNDNTLKLNKTLPVFYQNVLTDVPLAVNTPCPDFVYANYQDFGYVDVKLTIETIQNILLYLNNFDDPMFGLMVWQNLWQSVLNGHLSPQNYLSAVLINLPKEKNIAINEQILSDLHSFKNYLSSLPLTNKPYVNLASKALAELSFQQVVENKKHPKIQQLWLNAYIEFSNKKNYLDHISYLLNNYDKRIPTLSQKQRWAVIKQLNRYDYPMATHYIREEAKKDPSQQGKISKLLAYIVQPVATEKRHALASLTRLSPTIQQQVMSHLYPPEQGLLRTATIEDRFKVIITINSQAKTQPTFMENYSKYLTPNQCVEEIRQRLADILRGDLPNNIRQNIEQNRLNIKYCINFKKGLVKS